MPALTGEEVADRWEIIKAALKASAAPTADTNEEKLGNILTSLLNGRALCWMTGNKRRPRTVIILTISVEETSGTRNLLVYCAHGFEKESSKQYVDIVQALGNYARTQKCDNIISYIWNDKLKKTLEAYGAQCNYTLAVFPLN